MSTASSSVAIAMAPRIANHRSTITYRRHAFCSFIVSRRALGWIRYMSFRNGNIASSLMDSRLYTRSRNPEVMSSKIAYGSSVRGLSFVTNTMSQSASATAPISARFDASRSPPHPNTTMTFAAPVRRTLFMARRNASGVCA